MADDPKPKRFSFARRLTRQKSFSLTQRFSAPPSTRVKSTTSSKKSKYSSQSNSVESRSEILDFGPPPPQEKEMEMPDQLDSLEESTTVELTLQICSKEIRTELIDEVKMMSGNVLVKFFEGIESGNLRLMHCDNNFKTMGPNERNMTFLWCCFVKRLDLLEHLRNLGANINFSNDEGYSPLHLASLVCPIITNYLVSHGANIHALTKKNYTPLHYAAYGNSADAARILINNGAHVVNENMNKEESLLQSAVRANSLTVLQLLIDQGADVNKKCHGSNAIHLAADLGNDKCLEVLLNAPNADPNLKMSKNEKSSTALHMAADEGSLRCMELLLNKGARADARNYRGYTPLHMAAKVSNIDCVGILLRKAGADPNSLDADHRTPLHSAIRKASGALDVMKLLIQYRADVNAKDKYGFTALHLAALDGLSLYVETLISFGANVTTKNKKNVTALNVISRKTPSALNMITQQFNDAITVSHSNDNSNQEVEMRLDFRNVIQHCHPRETSYLKTFVDEGNKEFLEHPLCQAFLYLKWQKIRKFHFSRVAFSFLKTLVLTLFVMTVFVSCKPMIENIENRAFLPNKTDCQIEGSADNFKSSSFAIFLRERWMTIDTQWWILLVFTIVELCFKSYGSIGFSSPRDYFRETQNINELLEVIGACVLLFVDRNGPQDSEEYRHHFGSLIILLGWYNLLILMGQLPEFGAHVEMFNKIKMEFLKLFAAFVFILIGFTFSYCIIFSEKMSDPITGFVSVLVLMIGEQDLTYLKDTKTGSFWIHSYTQIVFTIFLFFITIVLMNLLVGIAVNDIQALKKTAELSKLVRQTKLIYHIESVIIIEWFSKLPTVFSNWIRKYLRRSALISPQAYRLVISVRPLNPAETRLPRDIMTEAYSLAKIRSDKYKNISLRKRLDSDASAKSTNFNYNKTNSLTQRIEENSNKIDEILNELQDLRRFLQGHRPGLGSKDSTFISMEG